MSGQKWAQKRAQRSLLSAPEFWVRRSRSRSHFYSGAALALPHLLWVRRSERRTQVRALCNTLPQILEVQLENGKLLHSMRKGDGEVTCLKLQRIIVELQQEFINDDLLSEN